MKHKRKLYYPVGILSLSILLFLFIKNLLNDPRAYTKKVMEVTIVPENYREYMSDRKKYSDIDIPPDGDWNVFTFTGDEKKNTKVFDSLFVAVRQYILTRDSLRGIEIRMNKKMPLNRFVQILDMLQLEGADQYNIIDSIIWVQRFPCYSKPQYDSKNIPTLSGCVIIPSWPYHAKVRRSKDVFVHWEEYFSDEATKIPLPIILAWLGLFSLNIVRLVKWRKVN